MDLRPIGRVRSPYKTLAEVPLFGSEATLEAQIVLLPEYGEALLGVEAGERLAVLCWFHRANREVLRVHPRGDRARPPQGVFSTRSPARPNPIGLSVVEVLEVDGPILRVRGLDALDGTPVIDLKRAVQDEE